MKRDKVDWWVVCRIKPKSMIDVPTTDLSFQDNEVEEHLIDMNDDVITPLNDLNGVLADVDDGYDDANLEDAVKPDLEATEVEDDEDENLSTNSDYQCCFILIY